MFNLSWAFNYKRVNNESYTKLQGIEFQILFIKSINFLALYAPRICIIKDSTQDIRIKKRKENN